MSKPSGSGCGPPECWKVHVVQRPGRRTYFHREGYAGGVTRDRIYADVEWLNHSFTLIDTGGIVAGQQ